MKRMILALAFALAIPSSAFAHFFVVQPSKAVVEERSDAKITIDVRFAHPFEQALMDNEKPKQFGVLAGGKKTDLLGSLAVAKKGDARTYVAQYQLKKPGDYVFYCEPASYWEPAEDKHIIHYTKSVVQAYGLEEGWDEMVGFPIEIKPLTRPYGLWAGNVFTGQVLMDGKPVPNAEIEVSYDNTTGVKSPGEVFNIQVVKADENGVFTYAMPKAGWWGFAALEEASFKLPDPSGEDKPVEIGAVMWVNTVEMQ